RTIRLRVALGLARALAPLLEASPHTGDALLALRRWLDCPCDAHAGAAVAAAAIDEETALALVPDDGREALRRALARRAARWRRDHPGWPGDQPLPRIALADAADPKLLASIASAPVGAALAALGLVRVASLDGVRLAAQALGEERAHA